MNHFNNDDDHINNASHNTLMKTSYCNVCTVSHARLSSVSLRTVTFIGEYAFERKYPDLAECCVQVPGCDQYDTRIVSIILLIVLRYVENYKLVSLFLPTSLVAISDRPCLPILLCPADDNHTHVREIANPYYVNLPHPFTPYLAILCMFVCVYTCTVCMCIRTPCVMKCLWLMLTSISVFSQDRHLPWSVCILL